MINISTYMNGKPEGSLSDLYSLKNNEEREEEYYYLLFCNAITNRNNSAWLEIQKKYQYLLWHWVTKTASGMCDDDLEDLVQNTYTKFWISLTKTGIPLDEKFYNLGCILQYLKKCAISTSIDFLRKQQRRQLLEQKLNHNFFGETVYCHCTDEASDLSDQIQKWVATQVRDPKEKLLIKLLFEFNLKPAEVVKSYPTDFSTTKEVNRVRERIMKRARRVFC